MVAAAAGGKEPDQVLSENGKLFPGVLKRRCRGSPQKMNETGKLQFFLGEIPPTAASTATPENNAESIAAGLLIQIRNRYASLNPNFRLDEQVIELTKTVNDSGINSAFIFIPDTDGDQADFIRTQIQPAVLLAANKLKLENTILKHPQNVRGTMRLRCPSFFHHRVLSPSEAVIQSPGSFDDLDCSPTAARTTTAPAGSGGVLRIVHMSILNFPTIGLGPTSDALDSANAAVVLTHDASFAVMKDIVFRRVGSPTDVSSALVSLETAGVDSHVAISLVIETVPDLLECSQSSRISRLTFLGLHPKTAVTTLRNALDVAARPSLSLQPPPNDTKSVNPAIQPLLCDLVGGSTRCVVGVFASPGNEAAPGLLDLIDQCCKIKINCQPAPFSNSGRLASLITRWDASIGALAGPDKLHVLQRARRRVELVLATAGRASDAADLSLWLESEIQNLSLSDAIRKGREFLHSCLPVQPSIQLPCEAPCRRLEKPRALGITCLPEERLECTPTRPAVEPCNPLPSQQLSPSMNESGRTLGSEDNESLKSLSTAPTRPPLHHRSAGPLLEDRAPLHQTTDTDLVELRRAALREAFTSGRRPECQVTTFASPPKLVGVGRTDYVTGPGLRVPSAVDGKRSTSGDCATVESAKETAVQQVPRWLDESVHQKARVKPTKALHTEGPSLHNAKHLTELIVRRDTSTRGCCSGQLRVPPVPQLREPTRNRS